MQIVPLNPTYNQTTSIVLNNQATTLNVYQLSTGLYMDVLLNGVQIVGGVLCLNRNLIIINSYLGYSGDFIWVANQTTKINNLLTGPDPTYTGLGSIYNLYYLTPQNLQFFGISE